MQNGQDLSRINAVIPITTKRCRLHRYSPLNYKAYVHAQALFQTMVLPLNNFPRIIMAQTHYILNLSSRQLDTENVQ